MALCITITYDNATRTAIVRSRLSLPYRYKQCSRGIQPLTIGLWWRKRSSIVKANVNHAATEADTRAVVPPPLFPAPRCQIRVPIEHRHRTLARPSGPDGRPGGLTLSCR